MEETKDDNFVLVRSYRKVWKFDKAIYSIYNVRLPMPVYRMEIGGFLFFMGLFYVLNKLFLFITPIPSVLKYFVFPYLLAKLIVRTKVDGKNPALFFVDYIKHICTANNYVERLKEEPDRPFTHKVNWSIGKRVRL